MVKLYSAQLSGLDATIVTVEADISPGLHLFSIVGLADKEVQESRERIAASIRNIGARPPHKKSQRLIINLAPADIKKEGPAFDLPIALGFLLVSEQTNFNPENKLFLGELSLDGGVKKVRGVLASVMAAKNVGFKTAYVPAGNGNEAALVSGIEVKEVTSLLQVLDDLENKSAIPIFSRENKNSQSDIYSDLSLIKGQEQAKRALEIAAAGGHNLLMQGPPGTGKTIMARAIPSILPTLSNTELIEVTKIYSAAGLLKDGDEINQRPFRSPHHTASEVAVVGGGNPIRPGEITMAHRGVLFLDEFSEFQPHVLNSLREPLEEGQVTVSRAQGTVVFPANIMLVAAMNPCPCGYLNSGAKECSCTPGNISKYQRKISGPLLDRIDLFIEVPKVEIQKIDSEDGGTNDVIAMKNRVGKTREAQIKRFSGTKLLTNSEMGLREIKKYCPMDEKTRDILRSAYERHGMSARSYYRTIKVARTIADLSGAKDIETDHIAEALQYRTRTE